MIKLYKNFVKKAKQRSRALTCCIFCVGDQRGGTKSVDPIVVPQTEKDKKYFFNRLLKRNLRLKTYESNNFVSMGDLK